MATCKYCGNETGGTKFCQSCGAEVEGVLIQDATPVEEVPEEPEVITPERIDPQDSPAQNSFYKPEGAPGLLAANIVVLVLSLVMCVHTIGITILALIFSIIGIVNASRVKSAQSEFEAHHRKSTAVLMLVLGIVVLFIGFVVYLILSLLKVVTKNILGSLFGF